MVWSWVMHDRRSCMADFCFLQKEENEFNNKELTPIKIAKKISVGFSVCHHLLFHHFHFFLFFFFFYFLTSTALNSALSQMSTNLTNKQKKQGCPWKSFSVADCGGEVKKLSLSSSRFQSSSGFVLFTQDTDPMLLATKRFDSKLPSIRRWPGLHNGQMDTYIHT